MFAYPSRAILLLGALLFATLLWLLSSYRRRVLRKLNLGSDLVVAPPKWTLVVRGVVVCLCWAAAVVALMHPRGVAEVAEKGAVIGEEFAVGDPTEMVWKRKAHDVIFLLDTSASMEAKDTRVGRSRLDYAKEIIDEVVDHLTGQTVALYAFTSEVTPLVPPTADYLYLRLTLKRVGINEGDVAGTDLAEALDTISKRHGAGRKNRTLILLTDGGDTRLEAASADQRPHQLEAILSRVDERIRVHAVGLGSHEGSEIPGMVFDDQPIISTLDEELLQRVGESYTFANEVSPLSIAENLVARIERDDAFVEEEGVEELVEIERKRAAQGTYRELFQWPLAFAVLCLGLEIGLPERRRR